MHTQTFQMHANDTCANTLMQMVIAEEFRRANARQYIRIGGDLFYTGNTENTTKKTCRKGILKRILLRICSTWRYIVWKKHIA